MATKTEQPKILKRWNDASHVEQVVWDMRLADMDRGENRAILNRLYNGDAPFPEATAEENGIQVNRNDLTGPNVMTQGRRQWLQAFLRSGKYFNVTFDTGPKLKRREFGHTVTAHANNVLHSSRQYLEQSRAAGGSMLLHGIGPSIWKTRRAVVPRPLAIPSLMIPSETDIDWDNLEYFAMFQEWTPAQLYKLTHGLRRDPGWNMPLVQAQWAYVRDQVQKQPNATAFQYMPERIEELFKQDMGWWGSDAVPTIDAWDFYFRADTGDGEEKAWYRRIILDWGVTEGAVRTKEPPRREHLEKADLTKENGFLYTSKNKIYAKDINEILHVQFGDCSAVFPQKYHSVRSLGWMLWGVCDLENRLHCKFTESLFEQMMWLFRTASNTDLVRLKKADFYHMGIIPAGIDFVKPQDRFPVDGKLVEMGFARFQKLIADNAASFTQDFDQGGSGKEMTATETMARVNSVNALVSGLLTLAYTYEEYKDREILRRLCIKKNSDPLAQRFYRLCLQDGVDPKMLDVDRMIVTRERSFGAGNKTLEMAIVQFLQQIRKNLGPDAQRRIDNISIETATDDATLAEELAPVEAQKKISASSHDAELSTDRLMRGLPYEVPQDAVPEDYVIVWMRDLALFVQEAVQGGGMATADQIKGFENMAAHIGQFLQQMENDDDKERVKQYQNALKDLMNHVKAFEQRLAQQAKAAAKNGAQGGLDGKAIGQIQKDTILAKSKAKIGQERSAQRMAQDQVRFELDQQRKEREHNAEMRRMGTEHLFDQVANFSKKRPNPFDE